MQTKGAKRGAPWVASLLLALSLGAACAPATVFASDEGTGNETDTEVAYTCTVTYNGNGGTFRNPTTGEMVETYEAASVKVNDSGYFPITVIDSTPTRTGYQFIGWDSGGDGIADFYPSSEFYHRSDDSDTSETLTAVWYEVSCTPIYLAQGGTFEGGDTSYTAESVLVDENLVCTVTLVDLIPVRPGYKFVGWDTDDDGKADAKAGDTVKTDKAYYSEWDGRWHVAPLYIDAIWERITLTYVANDGTDRTFTDYPSVTTDSDGSSYAKDHFIVSYSNFYRSGYYFAGWWTEPEGGERYNGGDLYYYGTETNSTLYAHWLPEEFALWGLESPLALDTIRCTYGSSTDTENGTYSAENDTYTFVVPIGYDNTDSTCSEYGTEFAWCLDSDRTRIYKPGDSITVSRGTTRLVMLWSQTATDAASNTSATIAGCWNRGLGLSVAETTQDITECATANGETVLASFSAGGQLGNSHPEVIMTFTVGTKYAGAAATVYVQQSSGTVTREAIVANDGTVAISLEDLLTTAPNEYGYEVTSLDSTIDSRSTFTIAVGKVPEQKTATDEKSDVVITLSGSTAGLTVVPTDAAAEGSEQADGKGQAVLASFEVTGDLETGETLTLTFDVGKEYADRGASVYIKHNSGRTEIRDGLTVSDKGVVSITVNELSTFTVAVEKDSTTGNGNEGENENGNGNGNNSTTPNTGNGTTGGGTGSDANTTTPAAGVENGGAAAPSGNNAGTTGNDSPNAGSSNPTEGNTDANGASPADADAGTAAPNGSDKPATGTEGAQTNTSATSPQTGVNTGLAAVATLLACCAAVGVAVALRRHVNG